MAITLPSQPTGNQFEEAVAAFVRSCGYFTENRTVFDYEGREILELDVVASPASDDVTKRILVDAKKSTARFADIFKIYGWRMFLKIPKGCIVHGSTMAPHEIAAFNKVCPNLEVYADHFDVAASTQPRLSSVPIINARAQEALRWAAASVGWYQLIADRLVLEQFRTLRKAIPDDPLLASVREYRRGCHVAFFEPDPFRRAELLYQAYKNEPGISGKCVDWQANKSGKSESEVWDAVRDTAEFAWIQHVMSLETHARILIIKNGLEAALQSAPTAGKMSTFFKALKLAKLPDNFRNGFKAAGESRYRTVIPYILQLYTELFGGFLVDDIDRDQLASLAGTPSEAISEALNILDIFYPIKNGWHTVSKEVRMMKMIPAYRRGIGAFMRNVSRSLQSYGEIAPRMYWLIGNWHNAALAILENELRVEEKVEQLASESASR